MKRTKFLIPVVLGLSLHATTRAQSVGATTINACGNRAALGGSEFEWSVGEMVLVSTFATSSVSVTQGVLQPVDFSLGVAPPPEIAVQLSVFPNPASTDVNISYSSQVPASMTYTLTDMAGRIVATGKSGKSAAATEQVKVESLACATYGLDIYVVTESGSKHSFYKIDKTK